MVYCSLPLVEVFGLRKRELCAQFQTSETFEAAAIEIAASLIHIYIYYFNTTNYTYILPGLVFEPNLQSQHILRLSAFIALLSYFFVLIVVGAELLHISHSATIL